MLSAVYMIASAVRWRVVTFEGEDIADHLGASAPSNLPKDGNGITDSPSQKKKKDG